VLVSAPGLEVRGGEVVGVAAVEGNGQRELLYAVAGVLPRPAAIRVADPVAFVPEDRTTEGLVPSFSLTENLVLGHPGDPRWSRRGWLDWSAADRRMRELIGEFGIVAPGAAAPARGLSGGNQQKVVFARALEARPRVLVAENPTRGLDVHATRFVHDRLRAAAAEGAAIILYSTDLDEVISVADRVVVVCRGTVRSLPPGADRATVGAAMLGGVG
jgi:simple sugar transport system ATP-binding protein